MFSDDLEDVQKFLRDLNNDSSFGKDCEYAYAIYEKIRPVKKAKFFIDMIALFGKWDLHFNKAIPVRGCPWRRGQSQGQ